MSLFDQFNHSAPSTPSTNSGDIQRKFIDYIKLQVYDDGYIDRQEEHKILEAATGLGLGFDEGLSIMVNLAQEKGWVMERTVEMRVKEALEQFAQSGGAVDKKEFADAVALLRTGCKNKFAEGEARRRVKQMIIDNGWKAKEGGLFGSNWFSDIH